MIYGERKSVGATDPGSSSRVHAALVHGQLVSHWKLKRRLGHGGNGEVWLAEDRNGQQVAIKFLMKTKAIAYARFRDEVSALESVTGIPGILPVLGSDLPT